MHSTFWRGRFADTGVDNKQTKGGAGRCGFSPDPTSALCFGLNLALPASRLLALHSYPRPSFDKRWCQLPYPFIPAAPQDLDSGHHGSGFPLPPFRAALLRQHLAHQESRAKEAARRAHVPAAEARAVLLKEKQELGGDPASKCP